MNYVEKTIKYSIVLALSLSLVACGQGGADPHGDAESDHDETPQTDPNLIAIPASVRANLGIEFVKVERRQIERTLRVPGRFEYLPTARREYRTALPGRVEMLVEQFAKVEAGDPLYRIDSPAWRTMQQQLADATAQIDRLTARSAAFKPLIAAHHEHEVSLRQSVKVWDERVAQLQSIRDAGGGRVDEFTKARASLADARAELASVVEKDAELNADSKQTLADLRAARIRLDYLLDSAAVVVSLSRQQLVKPSEQAGPEGEAKPIWATMKSLEVVATQAGVVESLGLTNGAWADEKSAVLTVVQPDRLRFRASGLQSDLGVLRDGLPARIVPPATTMGGRAVSLQDTMQGTLSIGLQGDPNDRTLELFVAPESLLTWARPGVTAQLEIVTDSTATAELAIPLAAVQRDGLTPVIFRRDPSDPNQVIRIEADLGKDDGRWVALQSGVREGDSIVLDGAFQLMLATSGSIQKGGHFHADGTFHEGED